MEPIVRTPLGKADVTGVESVFTGHDGQYVAILDTSECGRWRLIQSCPRDVFYLSAVGGLFVLANKALCLRVVLQHGVVGGVRTHVVEVEVLGCTEGFGWRDFAHNALCLVAVYPPSKIVVARGISVECAAVVANLREVLAITVELGTALPGSECKGKDGFYESGAVQLAEVHDEFFPWVHFERGCHIGRADELQGVETDEVVALLLALFQ